MSKAPLHNTLAGDLAALSAWQTFQHPVTLPPEQATQTYHTITGLQAIVQLLHTDQSYASLEEDRTLRLSAYLRDGLFCAAQILSTQLQNDFARLYHQDLFHLPTPQNPDIAS